MNLHSYKNKPTPRRKTSNVVQQEGRSEIKEITVARDVRKATELQGVAVSF